MLDGLQARESERVVLGALMQDGMAGMEHCLRLHAEMFYLPAHQVLFREMVRLSGEGRDWNSVSIAEVLRERKRYEDVTGSQGMAYLHDLQNATPYQRYNPSEHVSRIAQAWKRRRGAELCELYGKELKEGEDADQTLAGLQASVFDVIAEASDKDDPLIVHHAWQAYEALQARIDDLDDSDTLTYGCARLDGWTRGMRPGEMTVIGARSGVGKSSIMCQALAAVCAQGIAADCFSLEMDREEVQHRLWAINSGVEYRKIDYPKLLNVSEKQAVKEAALRCAEWPLRIYEESGMTIDEIVARARMSVRRYGSRLVCVDYAQIVQGEGKDDRVRVANVSTKLRTLAKDEGCHVMLLSQLRKVSHEQYSNPPTAGDLRETGQLENDAHIVILLHRPWDDERKMISNEADLLIPKFRRGKTGALQSKFLEGSLTFA